MYINVYSCHNVIHEVYSGIPASKQKMGAVRLGKHLFIPFPSFSILFVQPGHTKMQDFLCVAIQDL